MPSTQFVVDAAVDDAHAALPDVWSTHAAFQPGKAAIVCGDLIRSWGEFDQNLNRVTNALLARGIGRGDTVGVMLGNSIEMGFTP